MCHIQTPQKTDRETTACVKDMTISTTGQKLVPDSHLINIMYTTKGNQKLAKNSAVILH